MAMREKQFKRTQTSSQWGKPVERKYFHLRGAEKSGKTAVFKQLIFANGASFNKYDRRHLRYCLIKPVIKGAATLIHYVGAKTPEVFSEFQEQVQTIKDEDRKLTEGMELSFCQKYTLKNKLKNAILELWEQEFMQKAFRGCAQENGLKSLETFRLLMERFQVDEEYFKVFGTKKYLPDKHDCLLSDGWAYANTHFMDLKTAVVENENAFVPLEHPLQDANSGFFSREKFKCILFQDGLNSSRDQALRKEEAYIFVADVSAYDLADPAGLCMVRKSLSLFSELCLKGRIAAVVFTKIDILKRKYLEEEIPIDVLDGDNGDLFKGCPKFYQEEEGSVAKALHYFQKMYVQEKERAFKFGNVGAHVQRFQNAPLDFFCVNGLSLENTSAVLTSLLQGELNINRGSAAPKEEAE